MTILAIDPGPTESAFVILDGAQITLKGKLPNADLLESLSDGATSVASTLVIEMIACYGMAVGAEVFETCVWIGRFMQKFDRSAATHRITRGQVKMHLCHSMKAKDANIRQALIDRYGGPQCIKKGGALYGVSGDVWAALAVGVTWMDQQEGNLARPKWVVPGASCGQ